MKIPRARSYPSPAQDQVIEYVREHPGCTIREVTVALSGRFRIDYSFNALVRAIKNGRIIKIKGPSDKGRRLVYHLHLNQEKS